MAVGPHQASCLALEPVLLAIAAEWNPIFAQGAIMTANALPFSDQRARVTAGQGAQAVAYDQRGAVATEAVCQKLDDTHYVIDGKRITLPVKVRRARTAFATFVVNAREAQAWIADSGFQIVELWPGTAILQLLGVDYIENDLGDYNEAGVSFFVRQPGAAAGLPVIGTLADMARGKLASYIHLLPVNQDFTMHAGRFIWGYPKWNTGVEIFPEQGQLVTRLTDQGSHVFTLRCPLGGKSTLKEQKQVSLAVRQGRAYKTVGIARGRDVKFRLGGQAPELGDHPIAQWLRRLGLPKRPLMSGTVGQMEMDFGAATSVPVGQSLD
jgi:hypothetical protein